MMPVFKKAVDLTGDGIVELSTQNDVSKDKIRSFDVNWLEESEAKLLKQIDDEKKTQN